MKRLTAMAALFTLAACSSSNSTGPTDPCALDISNAYYYYGTPDSRTESANETELRWGRIVRTYIRQSNGTCSFDEGIISGAWNFLTGDPPMEKCRSISGRHFFVWHVWPRESA